jgi:hypothetical protein
MAKVVRFADGTFGVRRRSAWKLWLGYEFLDLQSPRFWWPKASYFGNDCHGTEEQARNALIRASDQGQPA